MQLKRLLGQGIRFALVGCVNTLVDMGIYYLLTMLPFFAEHYLLAQSISYSCGVINSLLLNKRFTFRQKESMHLGHIMLFVLVNLISLGVSSLALYLCVEQIQLHNMVGKIIAVGCSMVINFTLNKLLVFKD